MKKFYNSIIAICLIATSLTYSRPSQAAVGALIGTAPVMIAGLVVAGGGLVLTNVRGDHWSDSLANAFFGLIAMGAGLVILDGENSVVFDAVTAKEAKKIGLTKSEFLSFNSEIDQVNAVMNMVSEEVSQINNATAKESAEVWDNAREHLSAETFSAMVKVAQQMTK